MKYFVLFLLTTTVLHAASSAHPVQNGSRDPDTAKLITSDIDNFWRTYDRAKSEIDASILEKEYFEAGTQGLRDFVKLKIGGAAALVKTINAHPKYYASCRESTLRITAMEPKIRASFYALKYLYPDAIFPDVYFVIGRMSSGGTTSARGLLIGAEMYGRTPATPDEELNAWHKQVLGRVEDVPYIVAHELAHYQQRYPQKSSLLAEAIKEGSADFIGEMVSGGIINKHVHVWANPREREVWAEFKKQMNGKDLSLWLYNATAVKDRPADLGYYVGYKIAEAYYRNSADKKQAIRAIFEIKDFELFLKDSKYEEKF
jgi:predicted Zn-dependent protease DUF2268